MLCDCGHDTPHFSVRLGPTGPRTCCRACRNPVVRSVANPFAALTLDHVHDDHGRPLEVSSLGQLREAEKRYRFRSLVANERAADHDKPPQHCPKSLFDQMSERRPEEGGWLYPEIAEQQVRELRETGEIQ